MFVKIHSGDYHKDGNIQPSFWRLLFVGSIIGFIVNVYVFKQSLGMTFGLLLPMGGLCALLLAGILDLARGLSKWIDGQ